MKSSLILALAVGAFIWAPNSAMADYRVSVRPGNVLIAGAGYGHNNYSRTRYHRYNRRVDRFDGRFRSERRRLRKLRRRIRARDYAFSNSYSRPVRFRRGYR